MKSSEPENRAPEHRPSTPLLAADSAGIAAASRLLQNGGIVAFPTETVYGLGADATSDKAVAKIYAAKGRPSFNPLIAHVESLSKAELQGVFSRQAHALAEAFWPGPLTLVLPLARTATVCDLARAGLDSLALRVPQHDVAQALIAAAGRPIAAPSANRSGHVSPVTAVHVLEDLSGRIDGVLDGGPTQIGLESTIVSCLGDELRILRPGGLARSAIEQVLGFPLRAHAPDDTTPTAPRAPGLLASHYAPRARLRLGATELHEAEAGLDFGGTLGAGLLDLSPRRDLLEAAANLFAYLRRLDASGAACIAVAPIPLEGLGEAINDRLARAAAPRG